MGEDKIARLHSMVAGKTRFVYRRIGRFAVIELSEPPAAG